MTYEWYDARLSPRRGLGENDKKKQKLTWNFIYILEMSPTNLGDDVGRGLLARESKKVKKDIGDG